MMFFSKQQNTDNPFEITEFDVEDAQFTDNIISDDEDVALIEKLTQTVKNLLLLIFLISFVFKKKKAQMKSYCRLIFYLLSVLLLFTYCLERFISAQHLLTPPIPPPLIKRPCKKSKILIVRIIAVLVKLIEKSDTFIKKSFSKHWFSQTSLHVFLLFMFV